MFSQIARMKLDHQAVFAIIIAFAVVSFWRGVWGLMDIYLLPENAEASMWLSLALGLAILSATHYVTKELV